MEFISTDRVYEVNNLVSKHEGYSNYICRDGNKTYIASYVQGEESIRALCSVLADYLGKDVFEDLEEVFLYREGLTVVFRYDPPLRKSEPETFGDRFTLFEDLVTTLCVTGVPAAMAADMIGSDSFGYGPDGSMHFFYDLNELLGFPQRSGEEGRELLCRALAEYAERLFKKEFKKKANTELKELLSYEGLMSEGSLMELFEDIEKIKGEYADRLKGEHIGKTRFTKKGIEKTVKVAKRILVAVILAVALGFLVYTLMIKSGSTKDGSFKSIGEVTVDNKYRSETNTAVTETEQNNTETAH